MPIKPKEPAWFNSGLRHYLYMIRKRSGVKVESLAAEAGYSKGDISAWERGYRAPAIVDLINWTETLGFRLCVVPIDTKRKKLSDTPEVKEQVDMETTLRNTGVLATTPEG